MNNKLGKYGNGGEISVAKSCSLTLSYGTIQSDGDSLYINSDNYTFRISEVKTSTYIFTRKGMYLLKVTGSSLTLFNATSYTLHGKAENYGDSYADWEVAGKSTVQLNLRNNTYPFHIFWVYV